MCHGSKESMKNIQQSHELYKSQRQGESGEFEWWRVSANSSAAAVKAGATRPGNAPNEMDAAVNVAIERL
jgi:hypothetical protein